MAFSLALIAMLLLNPVTWSHCFLLLALPVLCIWMNLPPGRISQALFLLVVARIEYPLIALISVYLPNITSGEVGPQPTFGFPMLSCYSLCALFILGQIAARSSCPSKEA
jgi:hypothetical protein